MATFQELKTQILNANSIGRTNLAEKGVVLSEDATTTEIMQSIETVKVGEDVLDSEGVEF